MSDTIKFYGLLKKREDLSLEQFSKYWREVHAEIAKKTMRLTHYVQNHRLEKQVPGLSLPDFHGVAESIARNLETALAFPNTRTYREGVYKDEPNFMEGHATAIFAKEHVIITGPKIEKDTPLVKLMTFFQRKPGMSVEECHDYWLNRHAPLVPRTPGFWGFLMTRLVAKSKFALTFQNTWVEILPLYPICISYPQAFISP